MSNCPKCNEKLSPFYMKQNCPKCNTNLIYYNLEERLEADHKKAMAEQEAVDNFLNNIKTSAFGGALQIVRFITMFSPLLWMCLPMFKSAKGDNITLISVIIGIINGTLDLGDKSCLFPFITMVCIIVFSLAVIISSLFSTKKNALLRNTIFSIINTVVYAGCIALSLMNGATIGAGVIITAVVYIAELILHSFVHKKIHQ